MIRKILSFSVSKRLIIAGLEAFINEGHVHRKESVEKLMASLKNADTQVIQGEIESDGTPLVHTADVTVYDEGVEAYKAVDGETNNG